MKTRMETIQTFGELSSEGQLSAGGKGATLAQLFQRGYPVPDGFIILPAAFADDQLLPDLWPQVQAHLVRLRGADLGVSFAVRSSALSEDSAQASFAGEFETVLDVRDDEAVRAAIGVVRRSRRSGRVLAYSQAQEIDPGHEMAVVVQRLVPADISGILFTADPITGSESSMIGNYTHGLGELLVSGEIEPITFSLRRPKGAYNGPPELEPFAAQLFELAARLEAELGYPQDIEWAIAGRDLSLLQSRPITTLQTVDLASGEWNDSLRGDYLWTNTNLAEAVPGVMTPITWSLVQILHVDTAAFALPHQLNTTGNICGRPYLNLSVAVALLCAAGMTPAKARRRLEELFGSFPPGLDFSIPTLFSRSELFRLVPTNIRLELAFRLKIRKMPEFVAAAPGRCADLSRRIRRQRRARDLASLWREELGPYLFDAFTMLRGAMKWFDEPAAALRHDLIELVGPADANTLLSHLGGDGDSLASLGPVVGIARVAGGKMSRPEYRERYGHRGPHEWELSIPDPAEDPDWLESQLSDFAASPIDVDQLLAKQRSQFEAAWERFLERYPKKARSVERRIAKFAADARRREQVRSEVTRVARVARAFALQAGELTHLDDGIFFLTLDEMLDCLSADEDARPAAVGQIPARRETHARYSALPPYPSIINGRFDPFLWAADPNRRSDLYDAHASISAPESDTLTGFAGAAGRVEGLVRVLEGIEESSQFQQGEILVTVSTNIGWTPLFPRAAAIVTDLGAPLSHAAIVARELGVPAVVGCKNATMRLRTGDRVLVDGGQGLVHILSDPKDSKIRVDAP